MGVEEEEEGCTSKLHIATLPMVTRLLASQTRASNHASPCPKWVSGRGLLNGPHGARSPGSRCLKMGNLAIAMEMTAPLQFPHPLCHQTTGWCGEELPGCHDDGRRMWSSEEEVLAEKEVHL